MIKEFEWLLTDSKGLMIKFISSLNIDKEHKPYWTANAYDLEYTTKCYNRTQIEAVAEYLNAKFWIAYRQIILEQIDLQPFYGFNWAVYDLEWGMWKPVDVFQQDAEMIVYPVYADMGCLQEILLQIGIKLILHRTEVYDD